MRAKCRLLGSPDRPSLSIVVKAASLRRLPVERSENREVLDIPDASGLVAMDFHALQGLSPQERAALSRRVAAGATCYVRGGLSDGEHCSMAPFAPTSFQFAIENAASGYSFTSHRSLPDVLRGERVLGHLRLPVARGLSECAQPIALVFCEDGSVYPTIFAIEHGTGLLICDLGGCEPGDASDGSDREPSCLVELLESPSTRLAAVGALLAVDHAAGRAPAKPVGCDIVIDDRPANMDYFNVAALRGFLEPLVRQCPQIHVDFGWTPDQSGPSHRYVETLKRFNVGFVWHGLLHHVDHRTIANPDADFSKGNRLVLELSRNYRVKFQPVMVFPYEKENESCVALLKREGFIAKAETLDHTKRRMTRDITEFELAEDSANLRFVTLTRDSIENITRDRMLARAAIGLPVIVAAHPRDIDLRRLAKLRPQAGSAAPLSGFLDFVTSKGLRPQSLEQIAHEVLESRAN
jgi:hypothetical protein